MHVVTPENDPTNFLSVRLKDASLICHPTHQGTMEPQANGHKQHTAHTTPEKSPLFHLYRQ